MQSTLTRIHGVRVGHAHDYDTLTGCTVVLFPEQTTASVDVRGGAPGTRETDLLAPECTVQHIHAICLSGGSAFGLAAADGVMRWLRERDIGFDAGVTRVPIVPAAVIFDLGCGSATAHASAEMGYSACNNATEQPVQQGCVGAGTGATVGKLFGAHGWMKSGIGSSAITLQDGTTIAALVVNNAFGDICRERTGDIIAGTRMPDGSFANMCNQLRGNIDIPSFAGGNTTLVVVVTDATLSKSECRKVAQMAQDGMARTIKPVHTPYDGDVIFVASTNQRATPPMLQIGSVAADVVAAAIERSVLNADSLAGIPSVSSLP
ncbi:MAG: P1 family peptidase [Chloroflexi bacterium]|nr:P1 family peptidase [Chloroflexota bacterium]